MAMLAWQWWGWVSQGAVVVGGNSSSLLCLLTTRGPPCDVAPTCSASPATLKWLGQPSCLAHCVPTMYGVTCSSCQSLPSQLGRLLWGPHQLGGLRSSSPALAPMSMHFSQGKICKYAQDLPLLYICMPPGKSGRACPRMHAPMSYSSHTRRSP